LRTVVLYDTVLLDRRTSVLRSPTGDRTGGSSVTEQTMHQRPGLGELAGTGLLTVPVVVGTTHAVAPVAAAATTATVPTLFAEQISGRRTSAPAAAH